jgi:hypothetical protein
VALQVTLGCRTQEALRLNILRKQKREVASVVNHSQNSGLMVDDHKVNGLHSGHGRGARHGVPRVKGVFA